MTRPFIPHALRHGARPPHSASTPGGSGQGGEPPRTGSLPITLAAYLARGLAVMALVGVAVDDAVRGEG